MRPKERVERLILAARENPALLSRVASDLPAAVRDRFVARVAAPEPPAAAPAARPGLRKCASPFAESRGYTTQLGLFARSVGRAR